MGNFIDNIGDISIPKDKWNEFEERVTTIFNMGGSMLVSEIKIFDKKVYLIEPAKKVTEIDRWGKEYTLIEAGFNYFEEDAWESAGYNVNEHFVYSGKVGWQHHMRVMYAAHILQEIYSNEKCLTTPYNIIYKTIAWLNHLFNENYNLPMREDFFHIYKILKNMDEDIQPQDIGMVLKYMPRTSSFLNDSFYKLTEDFSQNMNFDEIFDLLEKIKNDSFTLQSFIRCTKSDLRFITRYSKLFNHHSPIEQIKRICHLCNKKHIAIKELKQMNKQNDSKLLPLRTFYLLPLFLFGLIANKVYNISKEDAINCVKNELMPDILYTFSFNADIVKERVSQYGQVTTEDFLSVSPDDRLYWWNETFILSDECKQWFVALKQKYNQAILEEEQNSSLTNLDFLKYFLSILTEHKTLFPTVIMFKNVFYDILNHSEDAHYRAMVSLIADFEDDINPELSHKELKKEHDTIKRYFALLANPQLRLRILDI